MKRIFSCFLVLLCSLIFYLRLKSRPNSDIEGFPRVKGWVRILGKGSIKIGSGFACNSGQRFNPIGGDSLCQLVVRDGALLAVGDNVGMSNVTIVCWTQVSIGESVMLGGGVKIYDTDFHPLNADERQCSPQERSLIKSETVVIKDGAFIGAHSIILKGVSIGLQSVIGAGSRVRSDVADKKTFYN